MACSSHGGSEARVRGEVGSDALGIAWAWLEAPRSYWTRDTHRQSGHLGHDPRTNRHRHTRPQILTSSTPPPHTSNVHASCNPCRYPKGWQEHKKVKYYQQNRSERTVQRSFGPSPSSPASAFHSNHSPLRSRHQWLQ